MSKIKDLLIRFKYNNLKHILLLRNFIILNAKFIAIVGVLTIIFIVMILTGGFKTEKQRKTDEVKSYLEEYLKEQPTAAFDEEGNLIKK